MASEIKVDTILPKTTNTLTLGNSNTTVALTGTIDGSDLSNMNASNLASGTLPDARFPAALPAIDGSALTGIETGTDWQSTIVTGATLTALAGKGYWIDTTSNECTITFPSSASVGDTIELVDYARTWGTNKIIIDSNGLNYQGSPDTDTVEYDTSGQALRVVYSGATKGWIPTSDEVSEDNPVTPTYNIDFLVIAGGGGGGGRHGGGGGAGGYRELTSQLLTPTTTYTVTVGAGGTGGPTNVDPNCVSTSGSDSVFSTTTSAGGGNGGYATGGTGGNGGSGGGGQNGGAGGSGNTPSTSPSQGNNGGSGTASSPYAGGGGGGAGSAGANASGSVAGNGGNGTASSITGSSVTRAGGGGGGIYEGSPGTGGTGGSGGGGNGSLSVGTKGGAGTANTGSGGGGGGNVNSPNAGGGNGGSGVVILSIPTASYSGTTTGSPTVTTSGSNTILTYTGSGSYTA